MHVFVIFIFALNVLNRILRPGPKQIVYKLNKEQLMTDKHLGVHKKVDGILLVL